MRVNVKWAKPNWSVTVTRSCICRLCWKLAGWAFTQRHGRLAILFIICHNIFGFSQGWKISWNIRYFRYTYQAFAHTLLKLYEIYYQIIVCVCALHIRWSNVHTALLWRGEIWQKLSNTEKMLRAQVISQQNAQTENQNVVTMCHIKNIKKLDKNWKYRKYPIFSNENIGYISVIYQWYISEIYIAPTLVLARYRMILISDKAKMLWTTCPSLCNAAELNQHRPPCRLLCVFVSQIDQ